MTPPTQPDFLKLEGDQIFIDASHRRKHPGKWVFVCCGDAKGLQTLYDAIIGQADVSKIAAAYQCQSDFLYWQKHFSTTKIENQ